MCCTIEIYHLRTKFDLLSLCLVGCHTTQLPCGHEYCQSCMAQLREKGVAQTCPLCRKPLPPGLDKLHDLGYRMFCKVEGEIDRSRPKDEKFEPWPALSAEQQRVMDQNYQDARRLYALASAQGYPRATAHLNELEENIRAECPLLGKRVVITGTSRDDLNGERESRGGNLSSR